MSTLPSSPEKAATEAKPVSPAETPGDERHGAGEGHARMAEVWHSNPGATVGSRGSIHRRAQLEFVGRGARRTSHR